MVEYGRGASAGTEGECRGSALALVLCEEEDSHRGGVTAANIERSKVVTVLRRTHRDHSRLHSSCAVKGPQSYLDG